MNRLYLERYHYLQSTYLKTKDPTASAAAENYRQMLIQIGGQLRRADAEFRTVATELIEQIAAQFTEEREPVGGGCMRQHELQSLPMKRDLVYGTP